MEIRNDQTTNDANVENPRCGGPDDARDFSGTQETAPAADDNKPRAGGPDDSRAVKGSSTPDSDK